MISSIATSDLVRELLVECIGTVMVEWEQWNFNEPSFDRGYFNDRIKRKKPVNALTRQRLKRLFEMVLSPGNRTGKFQEPQAVAAANGFIVLIEKYFHLDLSAWENHYTIDNSVPRSYLLCCLDIVLSLIENTENVPIEKIRESLDNYIRDVQSVENIPFAVTPIPLARIPAKADYVFGREATVSDLVGKLISGQSCYLHGIGGIGKTEIAKSVVKEFFGMPSSVSGFTHILWVNCTEGDFAFSLIRALNLDENIHNQEQAFQNAVSMINRYHENLLLVVDNIEDADDENLLGVCEYLSCRFLITSRSEGFKSFVKISVLSLSETDCMKLFYCYYHGKKDDIILRKIMQLADYHTVTIELLAKIADSEEVLLYEFHDALMCCGFHISSEEVSAVHEKMHSEDKIIKQLVKLFAVYGFTPEAKQLLIQIATIPNISFAFKRAKKWFGLKNRTLLNTLAKKGWIKKEAFDDNGRRCYSYYIHSVIASAVRAQFMDKLYQTCENFIREITIEMKDIRSKNDDVKKELVQFSWSINDIFQGQFHTENDCDFLWALAEIYRDIGYYQRAIPLLDLLFNLYTELYGENCIQLGSVWNSRGMIEYALSHFDTSLNYYKKSYDIISQYFYAESISSQGKINLAKLEMNMGELYLKTDSGKAGELFDHAYDILLKEEGKESLLVKNALAHKAMFLEYTGHLAEAEDIYIKLYNQISMDVTDYDVVLLRASVAHHIGNIYTDYAPEKALPFLTEAKNIVWNFLSPTHPDTLDVLNSICSLQLTINDNFSEILSDLQQLLELYLNVYGENNPQVGTIYNNIGLCYYYMDKPYEAISKYEEAVQISILSYGKDYPLTAYIYNNIGAAYSGTSHPEKAITEHEHALRIFEAAYPNKQNLDFALTHADLANCYLREKNIENTMKHLNEAFSIYQNMLPENAHQLIYPYCTLANLMVLLGDYENAVINFLHVVWLLLENGYDQNSDTVKDIVSKVSQLQKLVCNEEKQ